MKIILSALVLAGVFAVVDSRGNAKSDLTVSAKKSSPKPSFHNSSPQFYSPNAYEAQMTFKGQVQFSTNTNPTNAKILQAIDQQVAFLFGSLNHSEPKGAPKRDYKVEVLSLNKTADSKWQADYLYTGILLVENTADSLTVALPLDPYTIYSQSLTKDSDGKTINPCGDSSHPEREYYWYFFNPWAFGCQLVENQDYKLYSASLKALENTQLTFPEYDRLFQNNILTVDLLFGMDDSSKSKNPDVSKDINATNYRQVKDYLIAKGFAAKRLNAEDLSEALLGNNLDGTVDLLTAEYSGKTIRIRMFFGISAGWNTESFRRLFADGLLNTSVVMYAGHSGLGEYLDPNDFRTKSGINLAMNKSKYQILFVNGCSTYSYYNMVYFAMKKSATDPNGTKNLDIITNGLETYFSAIASPSTEALLSALIDYTENSQRVSYQSIIDNADSGNLIAVNGDEDNQ